MINLEDLSKEIKPIGEQESFNNKLLEIVSDSELVISYNKFRHGRSRIIGTKVYEIIDSDKLELRKGDIIKFPMQDYNNPEYRKGQFGVILERYRIITDNKA